MVGLNSNPPLMNPNQPEGTSGHENWGKNPDLFQKNI
jgi:hypothetical protein